jgi:Bacterial Ig-like domain
VVSYSAATAKTTLNPTNSLQSGATYRAVVPTGAKDLAGNSLDQNSTAPGLQRYKWFFTVS